MPRFQVLLTGDGLDLVRSKLHEANIPTMGPTFAPIYADPEGDRIGHEMLAVLDADTPGDAEERIRATLPPGVYRIRSTTPWEAPALALHPPHG
ncbi:MAG: hypothetical protein KJ006_09840 [Thermoleophilia bacterium]|nr:hypothetical protein [Thermoleophilia bacterium]